MSSAFSPAFPALPKGFLEERLMPPRGPVRLLIDTDTANEIDDQYAIAWAVLSPEICRIEAVTAEPFSFQHHRPQLLSIEAEIDARGGYDPKNEHVVGGFQGWVQRLHKQGRRASDVRFVPPDEGVELSYQEIIRVFDHLREPVNGRVHRGSPGYMTSPDQPFRNPAVEAIIDLAKSGSEPLYIGAMGCVTNIVSAFVLAPEIIRNVVVIWTSAYPSHAPQSNRPSLNLVQDVIASCLLFDSGVPLVYLPGYHVGARLLISRPEMEAFVRGRGAIGDYLHYLYTHNPLHEMFALDDTERRTWVIWDMIVIAWLLNPAWVPTHLTPAPELGEDLHWHHPEGRHLIREAYDVQRDEMFLDLYSKLERAPA